MSDQKRRLLCPVGRWKKDCYDEEKKVIRAGKMTPVSIWHVFHQFAQINQDDVFVYFVLFKPSDTPGQIDELELSDVSGVLLVVHIGLRIHTDMRAFAYTYTALAERFTYGHFKSSYFIDGVYAANPFGMAHLAAGLTSSRHGDIRPALMTRTSAGVSTSGGDSYIISKDTDYMAIGDFLALDRVYATGPQVADGFVKALKPHLSSSALLNLRKKMTYISHGAKVPNSDTISLDRESVVGFFGRFDNAMNKTDKVLNLLDMAYRIGKVDKVIATSSSRNGTADALLEQYPHVDFQIGGTDYMEIAQQARATVYYMGTGKSCALAMLEQMAYGIVPIVPRGEDWADKFFDKELPDYPWRFNNAEEAVAMLGILAQDDVQYKRWAQACMALVAERFELTLLKKQLFKSIDQTLDKHCTPLSLEDCRHRFRKLDMILETADELWEEKGKVDQLELTTLLVRRGLPVVLRSGVPMITLRDIRQILLAAGYHDPCTGSEVYYVKTEGVVEHE